MLDKNTLFDSTRSPISVLDFADLIQFDKDESARLQAPELPQRSSAPPPLDSITASQSFEDDDSSTLSSLSLQDPHEDTAEQVEPRKRSIFSLYWEKTGQQPIELMLAPAPAKIASSVSSASDDIVRMNAESFQAHSNNVGIFRKDSPAMRRSIMGSGSWSYSSSLPLFPSPEPVSRKKSLSASELEKKTVRRNSCLRQARYSGDRESRRDSELSLSSSVSFDLNVDIVVFQPPKEKWAAEGWDNYFR